MTRLLPLVSRRHLLMWFLSVSAPLLFGSLCHATLPAVMDVRFHSERVQRAASVFGNEEREWFAAELKKVSGPKQYMMYEPQAPMVGVRSSHELDHALSGLICPSLERGEVKKIQDFFANVNRLKLVRGRGNYAGWTVVTYHLLRENGQPWQLEARHQNVSGPGDRAVSSATQVGLAFVTFIDCAEFRFKVPAAAAGLPELKTVENPKEIPGLVDRVTGGIGHHFMLDRLRDDSTTLDGGLKYLVTNSISHIIRETLSQWTPVYGADFTVEYQKETLRVFVFAGTPDFSGDFVYAVSRLGYRWPVFLFPHRRAEAGEAAGRFRFNARLKKCLNGHGGEGLNQPSRDERDNECADYRGKQIMYLLGDERSFRGANFDGAQFRYLNFMTGADLTGASLRNIVGDAADLGNANLSGAQAT